MKEKENQLVVPAHMSWNEIIAELEKRRDKERYSLPSRMLVRGLRAFGRGLSKLAFWRKPVSDRSNRWTSPGCHR